MVGHSDPFWRAAFELEDLALWVGRVGWAFASAGGATDSMASTLVYADAGAVDHWREAPGLGERILIGIGSTAVGRRKGSSKFDVDRLVVLPGRAPTVTGPDRNDQVRIKYAP